MLLKVLLTKCCWKCKYPPQHTRWGYRAIKTILWHTVLSELTSGGLLTCLIRCKGTADTTQQSASAGNSLQQPARWVLILFDSDVYHQLRLLLWYNLRSPLTDNEAFGLRREVRQLKLQLDMCSLTASTITGCKLLIVNQTLKCMKHDQEQLCLTVSLIYCQPIKPSYSTTWSSFWRHLIVTHFWVSSPDLELNLSSFLYCFQHTDIQLCLMWMFLPSSENHCTHQGGEYITDEGQTRC